MFRHSDGVPVALNIIPIHIKILVLVQAVYHICLGHVITLNEMILTYTVLCRRTKINAFSCY